MIRGMHAMFYSSQAEERRAFILDNPSIGSRRGANDPCFSLNLNP
jgi:hypothetical protein